MPTALAQKLSEVISTPGLGAALGNAVSVNVLERLFYGIMKVTGLAAVEPQEFWARISPSLPKRKARCVIPNA